MKLSIKDKKKIAALAYEGYSIERINEHLNIPMFAIREFIENVRGYNL